MSWGGPGKRRGWGKISEGAASIEQRLITVIRAVQELVPGGVLRAGKTRFGHGAGWLLSITDGGAGVVDIGDEENYLRFDGNDFTWRTPLTELASDGTLTAVNAFFSGVLDAPTLDLELMRLSFQSISWAQFAIYENFATGDHRVDDGGAREAILGRGSITAGDLPETTYGWRSQVWANITTVCTGEADEIGEGYLIDSDAAWFAHQYNGFYVGSEGDVGYVILETAPQQLTIDSRITPLARSYAIRSGLPTYAVAFLSYLDSSNGGYGSVLFQARFDEEAQFQTFYQTGVTNLLGGITTVAHPGRDYSFRVRLTTDAEGRSPVVYKLLVCTDPSPWGTA